MRDVMIDPDSELKEINKQLVDALLSQSSTMLEQKEYERTQAQSSIQNYTRRIREASDSIMRIDAEIQGLKTQKATTTWLPELKALAGLSGVESIRIGTSPYRDGQQLIIRTDRLFTQVLLDGTIRELGKFDITIGLLNSSLYIYRVELNGEVDGDSHQHPHISVTGDPCFGNFSDAIFRYIGESEFAVGVQLILDYLQNINEEDEWGSQVWRWPLAQHSPPAFREYPSRYRCENCDLPEDECECCGNCGNYECVCCPECGSSGEDCGCRCMRCGVSDECDCIRCSRCGLLDKQYQGEVSYNGGYWLWPDYGCKCEEEVVVPQEVVPQEQCQDCQMEWCVTCSMIHHSAGCPNYSTEGGV